MKIAFKMATGVPCPTRGTDGSAGFDLCASRPAALPAGRSTILPTRISIAVPPGYVGLIRSRSGARARGLDIDGVIDSDYRGELKLAVRNLSETEQLIEAGERIAQLIVVPCLTAAEEVEELSPTGRGSGGFGSTGR